MGQYQAAELGHVERVIIALGGLIGPGEQSQRLATACVPIALHGRDLDRLIPQSVKPVHIAEHICDGVSANATHHAAEKPALANSRCWRRHR
jgi:hypothetical protein